MLTAMEPVAIWTPGMGELLIILVALLLLFGAKKLPEIARSVGRSTKEFKRGMRDASIDDDEEPAASETPAPKRGDTTTSG
jgi:sec-independent protein translocase protein TatA